MLLPGVDPSPREQREHGKREGEDRLGPFAELGQLVPGVREELHARRDVDEHGEKRAPERDGQHHQQGDRVAAEEAARLATFAPTVQDGITVKVTGLLTYEFTP